MVSIMHEHGLLQKAKIKHCLWQHLVRDLGVQIISPISGRLEPAAGRHVHLQNKPDLSITPHTIKVLIESVFSGLLLPPPFSLSIADPVLATELPLQSFASTLVLCPLSTRCQTLLTKEKFLHLAAPRHACGLNARETCSIRIVEVCEGEAAPADVLGHLRPHANRQWLLANAALLQN